MAESHDDSWRLIDPESVCDGLELLDDELLDGTLGDALCIPPPPMEDDEEDDGEGGDGLEEMLGELDVVV